MFYTLSPKDRLEALMLDAFPPYAAAFWLWFMTNPAGKRGGRNE